MSNPAKRLAAAERAWNAIGSTGDLVEWHATHGDDVPWMIAEIAALRALLRRSLTTAGGEAGYHRDVAKALTGDAEGDPSDG